MVKRLLTDVVNASVPDVSRSRIQMEAGVSFIAMHFLPESRRGLWAWPAQLIKTTYIVQ